MLTYNKQRIWLLSVLLTLSLLLAACGTETQEPVVEVGEADATPTQIAQLEPATEEAADADVGTDVITQTEAAAGTTGVTDTVATEGDELTTQDVTVITGTQLITGTEITTDVIVSTETVILEQQLITTVITATDVVTDVTVLTDQATTTETEFITDTTRLTPESETGAAAAAVDITQLTPTPTPTIVVELTRVVTATEVVTETVPTTVTATPAPRTPTPTVVVQVTRVITDTALVTDTRTITAVATPQAPAAGGAVTDTTMTGVLIFIGIEEAGDNLIRASTLLDYDFQNIDGQVSGEIEDILIDTATGQVLFVTLEYGGFLEIGDTELPVPLSAFTWGPDGELVLNFEEERLQELPDLGADWPDVTNPNWDDEVIDFWGGIGIDPGFEVGEASNTIMRVSNLIGYGVGDIGYGAGAVEDMLIALGEGRAKYLLVSYADADAFGDEWVVVPFNAFDPATFGDEFGFDEDFDPSVLEAGPRVAPGDFDQTGILEPTFDDDWDSYWEDAGYSLGEAE